MRWVVVRGVAVFAGSLVFTFFALEVGLRLFSPEAEELFLPHPVLGIFHAPGAKALWTREGRALVEINSQGLRDREIPREKPRGAYRILVLGDSFVEALQVPLEMTFPKVLERRLQGSTGAFEVINGGVSGFGTGQEYLYLKHFGIQYRPDLVVLAFYVGNDVRNNSEFLETDRATPIFSLAGGKLHLSCRNFYHESSAKIFLRRHSHLYLFAMRRKAVLEEWLRLSLFKRGGIANDYNVFSTEPGEAWIDAWKVTKELILATRGVALENGAKFSLVVIPDPAQVYQVALNRRLEGRPTPLDWDFGLPQKILRDFALAHGIHSIDLLQCFRVASGRMHDPIFFNYEGHFTPAGHHLVGQVIYQALASQGPIPAQVKPSADLPLGCIPSDP